MELFIKTFIQQLFNRFGYHISQKEKNVSLYDAFSEQQRLLSNTDVKVIFDIGAADGRTSEHYHQLFPNATIYAFEPLPSSFEELKKNVADKPYIIPLNYAVSDKIGETDFHITSLNDASSLLNPNQTGSSFDKYTKLDNVIRVKTITLDEVCETYKIPVINLLKIDAQGAELLILNGGKILLDNQKIQLIYSEVNFIELYKGIALFHDIACFLKTKKYSLLNLYNLVHNQKGQISWGDAIFFKDTISI
jgi:FkbM family methyltransferase